MLLQVYLFCLIVGGGLVFLSLMSGFGETDADADVDAEAGGDLGGDLDADLDAEMGGDFGVGDAELGAGDFDLEEMPFEFDLEGAGIEADAEIDSGGAELEYEVSTQRRFNPLTSLKFWTYTAAFFGLTGTIFEVIEPVESDLLVAGMSLGMGLVAGVAMAYLIHTADQRASEGLTERDYLGASAEVRVPVRRETTGEIRLHLKGRLIDMRADLVEGEDDLERGEDCFVIGLEEEKARVVSASFVEQQLTGGADDAKTALKSEAEREFDEELKRERQQAEHATS